MNKRLFLCLSLFALQGCQLDGVFNARLGGQRSGYSSSRGPLGTTAQGSTSSSQVSTRNSVQAGISVMPVATPRPEPTSDIASGGFTQPYPIPSTTPNPDFSQPPLPSAMPTTLGPCINGVRSTVVEAPPPAPSGTPYPHPTPLPLYQSTFSFALPLEIGTDHELEGLTDLARLRIETNGEITYQPSAIERKAGKQEVRRQLSAAERAEVIARLDTLQLQQLLTGPISRVRCEPQPGYRIRFYTLQTSTGMNFELQELNGKYYDQDAERGAFLSFVTGLALK